MPVAAHMQVASSTLVASLVQVASSVLVASLVQVASSVLVAAPVQVASSVLVAAPVQVASSVLVARSPCPGGLPCPEAAPKQHCILHPLVPHWEQSVIVVPYEEVNSSAASL
jgi:hypothetical protein